MRSARPTRPSPSAAAAADYTRVRGADHPDTLSARAGIARLTAQTGRVDDAIAEYGKLAGDYARVRGADHPDTLSARRGRRT